MHANLEDKLYSSEQTVSFNWFTGIMQLCVSPKHFSGLHFYFKATSSNSCLN